MEGSHDEPIEMLMNRARLGSYTRQHSPPHRFHLEGLKDQGSGGRSQPQNPKEVAVGAPGHQDSAEEALPERVREGRWARSSAGNTLGEPTLLAGTSRCDLTQARQGSLSQTQPYLHLSGDAAGGEIKVMGGIISPTSLAHATVSGKRPAPPGDCASPAGMSEASGEKCPPEEPVPPRARTDQPGRAPHLPEGSAPA